MSRQAKPRVGVLYGGISSEREVSLATGTAVGKALRGAGYPVEMIDMRDAPLGSLAPNRMDVAFIALHGTFGEDGGIQAVLDCLGVPYTGSGVEASRRAMDKSASKERFVRDGVPTPASVEIEAEWPMERRLEAAGVLELPVVVKPVNEGSSVGVTRVDDEARLATAIDHALEFDHRAMIEEFIPGRELTVGIVDGKPLPIIELLFEGHMFTYHIKYTKGAASHVVQPELPEELVEQIQEHAVAAHRSLRCCGCTRVDFRLTPEGEPYVLEVNTIPGMTETSLLPDAARAAGMSFAELCEVAIDMALRDRATRPVRA